MKKLTLDVEAIRVESFESDATPRQTGTVHAHESRDIYTCLENPCTNWGGCGTDDIVCGGRTEGDACGTSGQCDDMSACMGYC